MRVDHRQDSLLPRLLVSIYMLTAVAVVFLLYDQYRQGLYSLVLTNAIVIPALLFSSIFVFINRDHTNYFTINYGLAALLVGIILYQLPIYSYQVLHFIYAFPLFIFFALPFYPATLINLAIGIAVVLILLLEQSFTQVLRIGTNYGLLLGAAWCFAYLTRIKSWSLRRLALTDSYSGAYNYRHFYQILDKEILRSQSVQQNVSLIGLMIDDYSLLIDIHGPDTVNKFLSEFVDKTQQLVRVEDEIFRLNEDLFVLVLPGCAEQDAAMLIDRIKQGLQEQSWEPVSELSLTTTAVAVYVGENSHEVERRLLSRMKKQRLTSLQMSAFND